MSSQLQKLKRAVQALLAKIDVSTDCMSNQIKRQNIDEQINVLEAIVETIGEPMPFQVQELRPEVLAFALLMEQRLRDKDADKGQHWKERTIPDLRVSLLSKVFQMDHSLTNPEYEGRQANDLKHAVDLANFCMMIADVSDGLDEAAV